LLVVLNAWFVVALTLGSVVVSATTIAVDPLTLAQLALLLNPAVRHHLAPTALSALAPPSPPPRAFGPR
jgi:hypothetical protein